MNQHPHFHCAECENEGKKTPAHCLIGGLWICLDHFNEFKKRLESIQTQGS
jgi:hypothetical protein